MKKLIYIRNHSGTCPNCFRPTQRIYYGLPEFKQPFKIDKCLNPVCNWYEKKDWNCEPDEVWTEITDEIHVDPVVL